MQRFGQKLHALRTNKNITLKALAEGLDYKTHTQLVALESGRKMPTVAVVIKIARYFNVSTDELLIDELELPISSCMDKLCP